MGHKSCVIINLTDLSMYRKAYDSLKALLLINCSIKLRDWFQLKDLIKKNYENEWICMCVSCIFIATIRNWSNEASLDVCFCYQFTDVFSFAGVGRDNGWVPSWRTVVYLQVWLRKLSKGGKSVQRWGRRRSVKLDIVLWKVSKHNPLFSG